MKIAAKTMQDALNLMTNGFDVACEEATNTVEIVVSGETVATFKTPACADGMTIHIPPLKLQCA